MDRIESSRRASSNSSPTDSPDTGRESRPAGYGLPSTGAAPTSARVGCDLRVFGPPERKRHGNEFEELVIGRATSVQELDDGYAIRFPHDPALFATLASWIANESRCCPFFTFELRLEPQGGAVWMTMLGPSGVKAMLEPQLRRIPSTAAVT